MPFSNSHLFNYYIHFNITALFVALADCISLNLISRLPWSVLNKFVDINCFTKSKLKTNIHSLEDSEIQIYIHEPHFQNLTSESTSINTCHSHFKIFASDISLPMAAGNNYPSIDSLMVSNASNIASSDIPQQVPPQGNLGGSYTDSCSAIPSLNVATLQSTYNDILTNGWNSKHFTDMFGMMLEIVKNQQVTGNLCQTVQSNCERINELEN